MQKIEENNRMGKTRDLKKKLEMPRESRLLGEISITSDIQMAPLLWKKVKKNKRAS